MTSEKLDFERQWLGKFARCIENATGEAVCETVMKGSEHLSDASPRGDVVEWSRTAMDRLASLVEQKTRAEIMTGCACQYPRADLQDVRETYEKTKNIDVAHAMLQEKFVSFLRDSLKLTETLIRDIVERGWGLAGVRKGSSIIATKIPKSGFLEAYLHETDRDKKRALYCHCPRVRDMLKDNGTGLPVTYCYCGAGFYKGIWEEILQKPVVVEVLESVMEGDDVCTIAIHLPH
jgi:hypothetical protein